MRNLYLKSKIKAEHWQVSTTKGVKTLKNSRITTKHYKLLKYTKWQSMKRMSYKADCWMNEFEVSIQVKL